MLQNVIDTVNAMHRRQTELEKQASGRAFEDTDTLVESMKFGFDLQMYMKVSDDEHVKQLQVLEHSSKDVIRGITWCFLKGDCHKNFSQIVDLWKY